MKNTKSIFCFISILMLGLSTPGQSQTYSEWLTSTNKRIEEVRKAPLQVKVVDSKGQPVKNADIQVLMTRHAFEFGSAFKVAYINDPQQEAYNQKIIELFNSGTFENSLKVKAWSGDLGENMAPDATIKALNWTHSNRIKIRGHLMTGNGLRNSSKAFIKIHREEGKGALVRAVMGAIDDKATQTKFAIDEWDVVNHPVGRIRPGREAEGAGQARGNQIFGIEESIAWFEQTRKNLPEGNLYLNESGILSSPENDSTQIQKYFKWIDHVNASGLLDGIGLQSHFRGYPDIQTVEGKLDKIASRGLPIRITEFTADGSDEDKQGEFTRNFMTLCFSHPSVVGIQFWGFWEGNIFRPPTALFREDWSEKPNGTVYRELVFNEWWTKEHGKTDKNGSFTTSAFFGEYDIIVSLKGKLTQTSFILTRDSDTCLLTLN